ncbi:bifunctional 2-polyprenyl-6-hydroxyphenol methylase/3-demethylubiquinol 3-O-methyltransferase UbiG [Magnetovibrio sp.]|uniref:bifunctional 2-polyprenyl-6-hydroxyphenol methylase/3-demethylubiquinol 3-O-methyltransferase UbiG n=1 Tax=Magnetovibrio sp. TaxID=2024836 RepID=UPI002F947CF6
MSDLSAERNDAGAPTNGTANPDEIARFTAMADAWWDPTGKFRPLHQLNPARIQFIKDNVCRHFGLDANAAQPFSGLDVLDVGCGGGLLSEPMARLGANMTSIDAGEKNVEIAKIHAQQSGLAIDYRNALPEDLAAEGKRFDVVLNMEVIEHVADPELFMAASSALLKDDGVMVLSTMNRNIKSLLLGKVAAEYLLRWLPVGTHDWKKFMKPSELARLVRPHGLEFTDLQGMVYNPFKDIWSLSKTDLDVNYLAFAEKK